MRPATLRLTLSFLSVLTFTATVQGFNCSSTSQCQALVDYVSPNATTLSNIKTLFGVTHLHSILGANSMPLDTPPNTTVAAKETIKIPFPCICNNGSGISNKRPIYTVQSGDGLDHIARDVFSELMTYMQIAAVNNISNPNLIEIGDELWIPLPCSCDKVEGAEVVHYGHVVAAGSTVAQIATEYGTTEQILLTLNGIVDAKDLVAGAVLDVPLRACTSAVNNTSLDYPLLVPNGTYTFTAHNCVQCKCDSAKNWTLQCEPSPMEVKVASPWSQCPSTQCEGTGNLFLGNASLTSGCVSSTCAYAGYTNQTILTTLPSESNCTVGAPVQPSGNYAPKIGLQGSIWRWLLISLHLGLLCFGLLC